MFGTIDRYMTSFSDQMAARVEAGLTPLFDPEKGPLGPEVNGIIAAPHRFGKPKPAQAVAIEGILRALESQSAVNLVGEMGTGKTPMGCWIARALGARWSRPLRIVVTCPNQLVKKWRDHFDKIIPGCRAVIVHDFNDLRHLIHAGNPSRFEAYIIPRDRGKLSYSWRPGINRKIRPITVKDDDGHEVTVMGETYHCPRCGNRIEQDVNGEMVPVGLDYFQDSQGRPRNRRVCGTRKDGKWEKGCGEQLWQAYNGTRDRFHPDLPAPGIAPRRVSPAEFVWRQEIGFDLYIADEVHELSGEASLQGQMFGWLAARSTKTICATGTLVGGYAINLLFTLWRTMPARMLLDGLQFSDEGHAEFVKAYGVLQIEKKYVQKNQGQTVRDLVLGRGRQKSRRERSLPGISPQLYSRFLLPSSVFVRLPEMYDELPPFKEVVHGVCLTPDQAKCLDQMTQAFLRHAEGMRESGVPCRAWSAARACFLRWSDRPWPEQDVYDRDATGRPIVAFHVPELPQDVEYPKERRLRRIIRNEKRRGRKVWVYTEMTGPRWNVTDRLLKYLERHGIKAVVLATEQDGGPKPEDRSDWIDRKVREGVDVIISNPHLVKTGLDLYDFPTIAFYYCGDSTYTLRQASRRSWRLGQKLACEVHYIVYSGVDKLAKRDTEHDTYTSIQSAALALMAKKMEASLALEGEFTSEGLAAMADTEDMASALAKVIAGQLVAGDPKAAMASYRQRLEQLMPGLTRDAEAPAPAAAPADTQTDTPAVKATDTAAPAAEAPTTEPAAETPVAEDTETDTAPDSTPDTPAPAPATKAAPAKPVPKARRQQLADLQALVDALALVDEEAAAQISDQLAAMGGKS